MCLLSFVLLLLLPKGNKLFISFSSSFSYYTFCTYLALFFFSSDLRTMAELFTYVMVVTYSSGTHHVLVTYLSYTRHILVKMGPTVAERVRSI